MRFIADLHLHSKYSRATSERLGLSGIAEAAKTKGLSLIGTGDFTHPKYFSEIKSALEERQDGFLEKDGMRFILSAEIAAIWSYGGKAKKIHLVILAPSMEVASQINDSLSKKGNLSSDGRPILGIGAAELVEIISSVSPDCECIPAHAWTPWFSVFGAASGFDSIKDCFHDQSKHIHAIETGLSSDPPMNWRLSKLDGITLISNSDSHSPEKVGREANVFDFEDGKFSYSALLQAIRTKDKKHFISTIEFYPEEGKYHFDGHRACNVSMPPKKALALKNICPVCRKPLTIGVLHRVEELADRPEGFTPPNAIPFSHRIPLSEILQQAVGRGKKSVEEHSKLVKAFGNEFAVLEGERKRLEEVSGERVAEGIVRAREGKLRLSPGFDGEYGKISLFWEGREEGQESASQTGLKEFL